jgi:hypothetical protein
VTSLGTLIDITTSYSVVVDSISKETAARVAACDVGALLLAKPIVHSTLITIETAPVIRREGES